MWPSRPAKLTSCEVVRYGIPDVYFELEAPTASSSRSLSSSSSSSSHFSSSSSPPSHSYKSTSSSSLSSSSKSFTLVVHLVQLELELKLELELEQSGRPTSQAPATGTIIFLIMSTTGVSCRSQGLKIFWCQVRGSCWNP